jgi:arsenate reductase
LEKILRANLSDKSVVTEKIPEDYNWIGDKLEVYSAGTDPEPIRSETVEVMREVGIDISGQHSKSLDAVPHEVDVVVTVCDRAAEACPFFPGSPRILHWSLPDPARAQGTPDQVRETYGAVRDRIAELVRALVSELTGPNP